MTCEEVLLSALLAKHAEIKPLAATIATAADDAGWEDYIFIHAVAALIAGDRALGKEFALTLANSKRLSFMYGPGMVEALIAIAGGDRGRFLAEMKKVVSEYDERARDDNPGTPEAAMFMRGAGLLRLYELVNGESVLTPDLDVRLLPGVSGGSLG